VIDSSRFRGYIVDVIVASREFLVRNPQGVKDFVEAYLRANYEVKNELKTLVINDSRKAGTQLEDKLADRLIKGIWWKNTNENYVHMGLSSDQALQHIEDMIINITRVLLETNAIQNDPTSNQPNLLYYDKILSDLQASDFHPGTESIRQDSDHLPKLSEQDWEKLIPVGTLQVPAIVFPRGSDTITERSQVILDELVGKLKTWPHYYVIVRGDASLVGNIDANKQLAERRAKSVEKYLLSKGVFESRIKAVAIKPSGSTDVIFQLCYMPY